MRMQASGLISLYPVPRRQLPTLDNNMEYGTSQLSNIICDKRCERCANSISAIISLTQFDLKVTS